MLAAEIRGKIGAGRAPRERLEDVLTSNVFSIFRYVDELAPAAAILKRAVDVYDHALDPGPFTHAEVHFWPRFDRKGLTGWREPDALLLLTDASSHVTAVTVECKYDSGLSNRGAPYGDSDPPQDDEPDGVDWGHQLADEFMGLFEPTWTGLPEESLAVLQRASRRLLLYVTCHDEIPATDLGDAARHIRRVARGLLDLPTAPDQAIFWLSWASIHDALGAARADVVSPAAKRLLDDVRGVLELRGMTPFRPFEGLASLGGYEPVFTERLWSQELASVAGYVPVLG